MVLCLNPAAQHRYPDTPLGLAQTIVFDLAACSRCCRHCLGGEHPGRGRRQLKLLELFIVSARCFPQPGEAGFYRLSPGLESADVQIQRLADLSAAHRQPITVLLDDMVSVGKDRTLMLDGATLCEPNFRNFSETDLEAG